MKENDKWPFYDHLRPVFGNYMTIFYKTEVQTVILKCLTLIKGLNLDWFKSYDSKYEYFNFLFFCDILEKNAIAFFAFLGIFAFFAITVVQIMIQTLSALQISELQF